MENLISGLHFVSMFRNFLVDTMVSPHSPVKTYLEAHEL